MTVPSKTTYVPGEVVDVLIKGATVEGTSISTGELTIAVGADPEITLPPSHRITITRVASAEWPPRDGDIWSDRDGGEWVAQYALDRKMTLTSLIPGGERMVRPDRALTNAGPLTLVRRRGWTPAEPVDPEEPADPTEAEERAAAIASVRQLADLLEAHPELMIPHTLGAHHAILVVGLGAKEQQQQFDAWAPVLAGSAVKERNGRDGIDLTGRVGTLGIQVLGGDLTIPVDAELPTADPELVDEPAPVPA